MTEITPTEAPTASQVETVHGTRPDWLWPGYCCSLDKELQRNYGISCADYNKIFAKQNGLCAICGEPPGAYKLAVDHNKKTGRIRGLIHMRHNRNLTETTVDYILDPPADEFSLVVSQAKQRQLDRRRKSRKRPKPNRKAPRPFESVEISATQNGQLTYEEAIKQILGDSA